MSRDIDFSTVIASAVHDMKNSLGMLLNSLDELRDEQPGIEESRRFNTLQYEAHRVHGDLIQLLGIYRLQQETLAPHIEEHYVPEFLDEQLAQHRVVMEARGLELQADAEPVPGYFDRDLLGGVLNNVLNNAIRYTRCAVRVSAREEDGWLVLAVEDDGQGYPEAMRLAPGQSGRGIDFQTGSTNLGIYFAARIVALHQEGDRTGAIRIHNGGQLGGGVFEIWLP